jgi:signal transduction histidine kinase
MKDEADGSADYPVPASEVVEATRGKVLPAAEQAGIEVLATADREVVLNARVANLAGLVLANLVTNAIEASAPGTTVKIEARPGANADVDFLVGDSGPGIPRPVQAQLFRPVRSGKRGGGGVGLAISLRLAKHAGGNLELVRSDVSGTEFRLSVPALPKP